MPRHTRRATRTVVAAVALSGWVALSGCAGDSGPPASSGAPTTERPAVTAPPDDAIPFTDPVFDVARLGRADLCGLVTASEVTDVGGGTPESPPEYSAIDGLTTNCSYYDAETFELLAKVEIGEIAYADLILLYTYDEEAAYAECTVAERPALCVEPFESEGFVFGANVVVQLGEAQGPALLVEAPTVEQATALADLALARLDSR